MKNYSGDFTVNNGYMKLQFKNGIIICVSDVKNGEEIYAYNGEHSFADIRLYNTEVGDSWYLLTEKITEHYIPESCILKCNGPLLYTVITEGMIGRHKLRQTISLEHGSPRIDFKTEIWVAAGGIEGYFNVAFPSDSNRIIAGIPFGQESRELEKEFYSSTESLMTGDYLMFERAGKNVFFGKHYIAFENNNVPLAILQGDCSIYYRKLENSCELFLMRGIQYNKRIERKEKWLSLVNENANAEGYSSFQYSLLVGGEKDNFFELHSAAMERERPMFSMPRYYTDQTAVTNWFQFMKILSGTIILSAAVKQEQGYILRFFESNGIDGYAEIIVNAPFSNAYICDFSGNYKRNVVKTGSKISFEVKKYEIITIQLI